MDPDILYGKVLSPSYDAQSTFQTFPTDQTNTESCQNSGLLNASRETTPEPNSDDAYSDKSGSSTDTEEATPVLFTQGML